MIFFEQGLIKSDLLKGHGFSRAMSGVKFARIQPPREPRKFLQQRLNPSLRATAALIMLALAAGCSSRKDPTKANFKAAIDAYYGAHPECLWSTTVKFPTRVDTSDAAKTAGYDALTDQGLLVRQQDSRKVFIFGSKQVNDYDLSPKGRAAWTADPQNPGYGNFCYGRRDVTAVDDFTNSGGTAAVNYHYQLASVAPWANNTEIETAFPAVQASLATPLSDKANLTLTDNGWVMTKSPAAQDTTSP